MQNRGSAGGERFIPAWAGNTITALTWEAHHAGSSPRGRGTLYPDDHRLHVARVHPRVGGEHTVPDAGVPVNSGSSPRGRGTRNGGKRVEPFQRFIPAWAGNTPDLSCKPALNAVHPRVGGEHKARSAAPGGHTGSSPRGRGTPRPSLVPSKSRRFIPAWAGNTARHATALREGRFIPAWAGNTVGQTSGRPDDTVHPRVGGEHVADLLVDVRRPGSSPRGRGTRSEDGGVTLNFRFIPAWAGNTLVCRLLI